jgi:hypothetical protein
MNQQAIRIVVSSSVAMIATSAMAHAAQDGRIELPRDAKVDAELDHQIDQALAKRSTNEKIVSVFNAIAQSYASDGRTLADLYPQLFPGDKGIELAQTNCSGSQPCVDSTGSGRHDSQFNYCYGNCHSNCYSACHGACHGSRGWR